MSAFYDKSTHTVDMTIVSELTSDIHLTEVIISEHRFDSRNATPKFEQRVKVDHIPAMTAIALKPFQPSHYCDDSCFVRIKVEDSAGKVIAQDHVYPHGLGGIKAKYKPDLEFKLQAAKKRLRFLELGRDSVEVVVTNGKDGEAYPSIFTSLTLDGDITSSTVGVEKDRFDEISQTRGFFSENVFVLLPGESKEIYFVPRDDDATEANLIRKLQHQIKARSYNDMLNYV